MMICTYNACTLASEAAIEDLMMQVKKIKERNPRTTIKWDLFDMLAGFWEDSAMDNIDEDYDRLVEHLHNCTKKAESFKTTTRRLSLEALKLRGLSLEQHEPQGTKNSRPSFAEMR
ncbi:30S ribosomal protein S20 domain protein [Necator americanus]|uniref:30S ribosomal protein S20 domain protein n=1 Tax=Necator americanus TaxID=51031 RepID=W2SVP8_NECAM|nr:30S ribosomal protein S20 domain protein [Necator americanus]ETN73618.1 30S ribosomal protein S20 domain protein [Necator americanus]